MPERRAALRIKPEKPIRAKVKAYIPVRVMDISPRGALLEITQPLPPKTKCDLRVQENGDELVLQATVRRCCVWGYGTNDRLERVVVYRAGLQFRDLSGEQEERLSTRVMQPVGADLSSGGRDGADSDSPILVGIDPSDLRKEPGGSPES
ncbi:MAG: PilZ domain-containing protein [Acidobacteriota bacterium]